MMCRNVPQFDCSAGILGQRVCLSSRLTVLPPLRPANRPWLLVFAGCEVSSLTSMGFSEGQVGGPA